MLSGTLGLDCKTNNRVYDMIRNLIRAIWVTIWVSICLLLIMELLNRR